MERSGRIQVTRHFIFQRKRFWPETRVDFGFLIHAKLTVGHASPAISAAVATATLVTAAA